MCSFMQSRPLAGKAGDRGYRGRVKTGVKTGTCTIANTYRNYVAILLNNNKIFECGHFEMLGFSEPESAFMW